ncbi:hypothetical protein HDV05_004851 [Chytridiales sp. JEL 0842]|nr:hypothetical protein HDV05_004851 [Chytridiales sp. JEL 0842]
MLAKYLFLPLLTLLISSFTSAQNVDPMEVPAVYPLTPVGDTIFTTGQINLVEWTSNRTAASAFGIVNLDLHLGTGSENQVRELGVIVENLKFPETESYEYRLEFRKYDVTQNYTIIFKGKDAAGVQRSHNFCTWFKFAQGQTDQLTPTTAPAPVSTSTVAAAPVSTISAGSTKSSASKTKVRGKDDQWANFGSFWLMQGVLIGWGYFLMG